MNTKSKGRLKIGVCQAPRPTVVGHNSMAIEWVARTKLKASARNPRVHSKRQIEKLARSIASFGFNVPVLIDDSFNIIAGCARVDAAARLGMGEVPCIALRHLSETQIRAFMIAENRLSELGSWDETVLAEELKILSDLDLDFDIESTGFDMGEIDLKIEGLDDDVEGAEPDNDLAEADLGPKVTRPGDLWILDRHRLLCGNALEGAAYLALMAGAVAHMVFTDPPYNVKIDGHAGGKGSIHHKEFAMASGEMSSAEFEAMLIRAIRLMVRNSRPGSIHMIAMDWRHTAELLNAGGAIYAELKNICVWTKHNAGMGSLYRSQHEFFFIFKHGKAVHRNNVRLGEYGRHRTNVWSYPGVGGFGAASEDGNLLALHPTVKPTALVADAILDCSARGEVILDPFLGSGTTLLAAERTGRRGFGMELEPAYVDLAIRRWQRLTGGEARLEATGETFDERARCAHEQSGEAS